MRGGGAASKFADTRKHPAERDGLGFGQLTVDEDRGKPKPGAGRELLFRGPGQREFLADLQRFFAQQAVNGTLEFPYGVQEALARRCAFAQADPRRPPASGTHGQNVVALAGCVSQLQQSASWNEGLV